MMCVWHRREPRGRWLACGLLFLFAGCLPVLAAPAAAQEDQRPRAAPEWPHPLLMLIRDPAVQAELELSAEQVQQVATAVDAVDREMWVLRDHLPAQGGPALASLAGQLASQLKPILRAPQRQRLDQLLIQARGVAGLVQPSVARRLGLSAAQLAQMRGIQDETAAAVDEVRKQAEGNPSAALSEQAAKLRADGQKRLGEVLTLEQRERLAALVGQPFEFAKLKRIAARAPEFAGVQTWLNGPPRNMAELRGKVVVLHFFAFGCINCIHNYPWYKAWQQQFAGRDFELVGVHTPETDQERQLERLAAKLGEDGLTFPVAVDAQAQTWNTWGNHIWPAVYLIDKQGQVRYWWYGELKWNGADGEKHLREKIEELLAEKE